MKKLNKKGFTLAELLIVVAIIAVLVAITIPVFGTALNKAQLSADAATVRANLAEAIVNKMTDTGYDGAISIAGTTLATNVKNCGVSWVAGTATAQGTITVTHRSNSATNALTVAIPYDADVTITGDAVAAPST